MVIRELHEDERESVRAFLIALDDNDRYRRFGRVMIDAAIGQYVDRIDWQAGVLLGAFDRHADLVGLLELSEVGGNGCEIAIAVQPQSRARGLGGLLMRRALLKAKVRGCDRVVLLCQLNNQPMRRLAQHAGLVSVVHDGDVESGAELDSAEVADMTEDMAREAIGNTTYAGLLATRSWAELFEQAVRATSRAVPKAA